MSIKENDSELLTLEKQYEELDDEFGSVGDEIEELQSKQSDIECSMEEIETRISIIRKKMLETEVEILNFETGDKFTNDFMKASYFTARSNPSRISLQIVSIKENEIWALDGYRAIIITNNEIPENLKNTNIHWDIRENFEDNIFDEKMSFIDIRNVIPKKDEAKYVIANITSENFDETFKSVLTGTKNYNIVKLYYKDFLIGARKEYLNDALMVLKGKKFTVYFFTSVSPILIECDNMEIMILPVRLCD